MGNEYSKGFSQYSNLLIICNDRSANQESIKRFIEKSEKLEQKSNLNLDTHSLSELNNPQALENLIREHGSETVIGIAGGDGTLHHFYNFLTNKKLERLVTIISGGGSNDTAAQLHPFSWYRNSPKAHLEGYTPYHQPLTVEVNNKDYQKIIHTVSYFSIGLTALLAQDYNSEEFRNKVEGKNPSLKRVYQAREIPKFLKNAEPFIYQPKEGKAKPLYDLVIPNGNRMSGGAIHFSGVDLLEPKFGKLEVTSNKYPSVFKNMGKTLLSAYPKYSENQSLEFSIKTIDESDIIIQADGEDYQVPNNSNFKIYLGEKAVRFVTTRFNIPENQKVA